MKRGDKPPIDASELPSRGEYAEILSQGIAESQQQDTQRFVDTQAAHKSRGRFSPVTRTIIALVVVNSALYLKHYFDEQQVLALDAADAELKQFLGTHYQQWQAAIADEAEFGTGNRREQSTQKAAAQ